MSERIALPSTVNFENDLPLPLFRAPVDHAARLECAALNLLDHKRQQVLDLNLRLMIE
ncbi:hypothetical protein V5F77_19535 [Xanthobacter sp. DSM 24535]|uniref:hypothetical protein n=1 Tax=Roseixanthobacter psychrophilus TaxID=3119917 RepID=UPI00372C27EA